MHTRDSDRGLLRPPERSGARRATSACCWPDVACGWCRPTADALRKESRGGGDCDWFGGVAGYGSAPAAILIGVYCAMTGRQHRLFWMRSAWWCGDCRQKVESCCDGGGCPPMAEARVAGSAAEQVPGPVIR